MSFSFSCIGCGHGSPGRKPYWKGKIGTFLSTAHITWYWRVKWDTGPWLWMAFLGQIHTEWPLTFSPEEDILLNHIRWKFQCSHNNITKFCSPDISQLLGGKIPVKVPRYLSSSLTWIQHCCLNFQLLCTHPLSVFSNQCLSASLILVNWSMITVEKRGPGPNGVDSRSPAG